MKIEKKKEKRHFLCNAMYAHNIQDAFKLITILMNKSFY